MLRLGCGAAMMGAMSWVIPAAHVAKAGAVRKPHFGALPPRLAAVAAAVPQGARVADVGTDHGLLPHALVSEGRAARVTAVDVSPAALVAARALLAAEVARGRAAVRLADGLDGLAPGEIDVVVLAGLGGPNTTAILGRAFAAGHRPARVIVQALGGEGQVRQALVAAGYGLADEALVADGRRLFLTLSFDRDGGWRGPLLGVDLVVGPVLRHRRDALLAAWLDVQRAWLAPRVAALTRAGDPAAADAAARLAAIEACADEGAP